MCFNPDLLPDAADPVGSVRYDNVNICHEKIKCKHDTTTFYDDIDKNNTFIVEDKSPLYDGYEVHMFEGVVLRENNSYSWWHKIINKENKNEY